MREQGMSQERLQVGRLGCLERMFRDMRWRLFAAKPAYRCLTHWWWTVVRRPDQGGNRGLRSTAVQPDLCGWSMGRLDAVGPMFCFVRWWLHVSPQSRPPRGQRLRQGRKWSRARVRPVQEFASLHSLQGLHAQRLERLGSLHQYLLRHPGAPPDDLTIQGGRWQGVPQRAAGYGGGLQPGCQCHGTAGLRHPHAEEGLHSGQLVAMDSLQRDMQERPADQISPYHPGPSTRRCSMRESVAGDCRMRYERHLQWHTALRGLQMGCLERLGRLQQRRPNVPTTLHREDAEQLWNEMRCARLEGDRALRLTISRGTDVVLCMVGVVVLLSLPHRLWCSHAEAASHSSSQAEQTAEPSSLHRHWQHRVHGPGSHAATVPSASVVPELYPIGLFARHLEQLDQPDAGGPLLSSEDHLEEQQRVRRSLQWDPRGEQGVPVRGGSAFGLHPRGLVGMDPMQPSGPAAIPATCHPADAAPRWPALRRYTFRDFRMLLAVAVACGLQRDDVDRLERLHTVLRWRMAREDAPHCGASASRRNRLHE